MHDKLNVLLLTVDSLRADHLSCYGYHRETSPFIDSLAEQGVLAEQFIATVVPTQPSYTTLLTGQYPVTHNIVAHGGRAELNRESPIVSELFLEEGYATCSVDNLWRQRFWFGRGFEFIIDPSVNKPLIISVTAEDLNRRTIPWIREHRDEPFFLFMHYWDPHYPYVPADKYRHLFYSGNPVDSANRSLEPFWEHPMGMLAQDTWLRTPKGHVTDAEYVTALYDQEIRQLDDGVRDIVTALDEMDLAEQTLVVVIGDHGESMTEHGIFYEHYGLYDAVLRVPMIMRLPGKLPAGVRLPHMLQHVDIAPTLLDAAGLSVPRVMEGKSFWPYAGGQTDQGGYDAVISAECTWQACWSIRTDRYKLILPRPIGAEEAAEPELYDLSADPDEEHDLVTDHAELAADLRQQLEAWLANRMKVAEREIDPLIEQGPSLRVMLEEVDE